MKHLPLENLEQALEHRFQRRELLEQALTHSSYVRENESAPGDNEQLEFLGDAVLQLVASQELLERYPQYQEGTLSKLRAHLVNARYLVHCAERISLGEYLRLGHGEEKTGGRHKTALLADAVEAILAALYLDGGMEAASHFIVQHILNPELERLASAKGEVLVADHKSLLQQMLRAAGRPEPVYELVREEGPDHKKSFTMRVLVQNASGEEDFVCPGHGATKKAASQAAAKKALEHLEGSLHG